MRTVAVTLGFCSPDVPSTMNVAETSWLASSENAGPQVSSSA